MYEYNEQQVVTPDEFSLPFSGTWHPNNCWVKLAQLIPREKVEELYLPSLKDTSLGNKAYLIRKTLGTPIINQVNEWVVEAQSRETEEMQSEQDSDNDSQGGTTTAGTSQKVMEHHPPIIASVPAT